MSPTQAPFCLRVLSYNIHKGFGTGGFKFTLSEMRDALRSLGPDLMCLQEVSGHHIDRPQSSQFDFLADGLWPHVEYGKNAVYLEGHHGNAVLSRYPIQFSENMDVSTNRLERRGLLHAVIELPHRRLHVICLHLDLFESGRTRQVSWLIERIEALVPEQDALIVAGDFNDWRGSVSPILFDRLGLQECFRSAHRTHAKTFPAWLPLLPLDRIYFRKAHVIQASRMVGAPWSGFSDHAPIWSELGIE